MIKAIYKAPNTKAVAIELENTLAAYKEKLGGYPEVIELGVGDNIVLICNESGRDYDEIQANFILALPSGWTDILAGPIMLVGTDNDTIISLTREQQKKYLKTLNKAKGELGMTIPFVRIGG